MTPIYTMIAGIAAGFTLALILHLCYLLWRAKRPAIAVTAPAAESKQPTYTTPAGQTYERPVEAPTEDLVDDFEEQVQESVDSMSITPDVNDLGDAAAWARQAIDLAKATE